ncbi:hypothetical protein KMW28_11465 [Flammeovirga yaeyamensis]|uniref:Lipoprotein n=1 Tax=Flammeovirga yaeyamensis TaxID=367791 RepID=A0AAX1MY79_9BACT|nr:MULTISPECIES: hypothetical protein [Flammeovirga]ANQ48321.1 hypothetical protein MY04_0939 [Flammeovirga sp. MY04]MBB3696223.1 hypothetical protein [Flammeovirga yaeyamensis]NMF34904.1 hypothetical protein [Flammeovirga yaeyamensis]QWG00270.1 hypothetical protein KMW28_11465 [Flammeovirga yaeyamensis]
MKNHYKIFLGCLILVVGAFSCDPLKDIRDKIGNGVAPTVIDYELLEDDYSLSCNENVAKFGNFSASAPADDDTCGIAQIINQKFFGTDGDIMNATYKFYNGSSTIDTVSALKWDNDVQEWAIAPVYTFVVTEENHNKEYTVTSADYTSQGESYPNFDSNNNTQDDVDQKIGNILNAQTTIEIVEGDIIQVTYASFPDGSFPSPRSYKATLP